jgi:hypothetical protein
MSNKKAAIPINSKVDFPFNKPRGENSVRSTGVLFEDRKYYSEFILPYMELYLQRNDIFGNLTEKNSLYGLVDTNMDVVAPLSLFMKEVPSSDNDKKYVLDFVADAFNEMNSYLKSAAAFGKFSKTSVFYDLKVSRAHDQEMKILGKSKEMWIYSFKEYLLNDLEEASTIKDAKTFNISFLKYIRNRLKVGKTITKTATILSSNFSSFLSGLILDIAKDKADNDTIKFDKYLSDKEFTTFCDACKRFGFLIDANQPWRLIADLSSPAMLGRQGNHIGYMTRYDIASVEDMFNIRFYKTYLDEIEYLKDLFYSAYQSLLKDYPFYDFDYKKLDICDFKQKTADARVKITKEEYSGLYKEKYWVRAYAYLRNYEELRGLKQQEFENIVREANNFVSINRTREAVIFVNSYFKQFKNIHFLSSLQGAEEVVEQRVETRYVSDLIF